MLRSAYHILHQRRLKYAGNSGNSDRLGEGLTLIPPPNFPLYGLAPFLPYVEFSTLPHPPPLPTSFLLQDP